MIVYFEATAGLVGVVPPEFGDKQLAQVLIIDEFEKFGLVHERTPMLLTTRTGSVPLRDSMTNRRSR